MTIHDRFLEKAICAALSAIELYNKPDFKYREESFCILITNAWELLLKAKLVHAANENIEAIFAVDSKGMPKTTRTGNSMTIDVLHAANKTGVDMAVRENLSHLVEIRDTAIHHFHEQSIAYLVYALGVAALRNFQQLATAWFDRSLSEYTFYILPLGFAYQFQTLSMLDLETHPENISNILRSAAETQERIQEGTEFYFVCEVGTQVTSAKKIVGESHFTTAIDPNATDSPIFMKFQQVIDKYPLSYKEVFAQVKSKLPNMKQPELNKAIKDLQVKHNSELAYFIFANKKQEENYKRNGKLPKAITSVYNINSVRAIVDHLSR